MEDDHVTDTNTGFALPKHEDIIIEYIKEKDSLRSDLKEKEQEILKLRSKVYDLNQTVDELKKKTKTKGKENMTTTDSPQLSMSRPATGKARTPLLKRGKSAKRRKAKSIARSATDKELDFDRADVEKFASVREVIGHYLEVAEKFPELKLSVMMEAEKVFYDSDINNDGYIDEKEMEAMLTRQGYLLTNAELQKIMSQVDVDNSKSIDLMEYLTIMEKIQQRKRVDLPQQLAKSTLCVIQ